MTNTDASPAIILRSQIQTVQSTFTGDEYELAIWVPPSYDTSTHQYPTLYILDSPLTFGFTVPVILGEMWENLVPEMIIVGIGKEIRSYDEWWPIRSRDYAPLPLPNQPDSGHADAFLECIRSDIVPFIDTHFRTNSKDRIIWGHSLAGAFVLYALFHQSIVFHRYIATSPAVVLDEVTLIDTEVELPLSKQALPVHLFVSVGSLDQGFGPYIASFITSLHSKRYSNLWFTNSTVSGFGHSSALPLGFIQGLRAVFSDQV
jgi:uncharacterized protein